MLHVQLHKQPHAYAELTPSNVPNPGRGFDANEWPQVPGGFWYTVQAHNPRRGIHAGQCGDLDPKGGSHGFLKFSCNLKTRQVLETDNSEHHLHVNIHNTA
jgi:hypothetical protein